MPIQRYQRKRVKGYKLPPNTVCVTRGTKYGNPFAVGKELDYTHIASQINAGDIEMSKYVGKKLTMADSLYLFKRITLPQLNLEPIRNKNLACFCPLDAPCHADVLIEEINKLPYE